MQNVTTAYKTEIANISRKSDVYGYIIHNDGTLDNVTCNDIDTNTFKITRKINSSGAIGIGGVYPAELSLTLINRDDNFSLLDSMGITMGFRLYFADGTFETVDLGYYYVDTSTIKRTGKRVSFRAYDRMIFFDTAVTNVGTAADLYYLVGLACEKCGVVLGMTETEFNALPNATTDVKIDSAEIQTWRDFLSWVGFMTGTNAFINRDGELVFIQVSAEYESGTGEIQADCEIAGNIRSSTTFSDGTVRVTGLSTTKDGNAISVSVTTSDTTADKIQLELPENPLYADFTTAQIETILTNILGDFTNGGLVRAAIRPFTTTLNNSNPALDIGDYVKLTGGLIDTSVGYAKGLITAESWSFRSGHKLTCASPSTVQSAVILSGAQQSSGAKPQVDKSVDSLKKRISAIETDNIYINYQTYTATNAALITLSATYQTAATLNITVSKSTTVMFTNTAQSVITTAGTVNIKIVIDGITNATYTQTVAVGSQIINFARPLVLAAGNHQILIMINAVSAAGTIAINDVQAAVFGVGLGTYTYAFMPVMTGVTDYFDCKFDLNASNWGNQSSGNNLVLTTGEIDSDGSAKLASGKYGTLSRSLEPQTVYLIFKETTPTTNWLPVLIKCLSVDVDNYAFDIFNVDSCIISAGCATIGIIRSNVLCDSYHVVAMAKDNGTYRLYIDSVLIGSANYLPGNYGGSYTLNVSHRGNSFWYNSFTTNYLFMAMGDTSHSEAEIVENSEWLKNYYGI